jgi:Fe-S oxidoreductase
VEPGYIADKNFIKSTFESKPDYGWRFHGETVLLPEDRSVLVDDSANLLEKALRQLSMEYYVLDRCMQCGICTETCPHTLLNIVDKFSPREFIQKARLGLLDMSQEDLWMCTNCGSCKLSCPYDISLIEVITSLRNLVLDQGAGYIPVSIKSALSSVSSYRNPWHEETARRGQWLNQSNIQPHIEDSTNSVLLFVGCLPSYDKRAQKIALAAAKLYNHAGIRFAILNDSEACCGESVLRAGDYSTFETLKKLNQENFAHKGINSIYTISPHCFDVIKKRYFDENDTRYTIQPLILLLHEIVKNGSLKFDRSLDKKITYHDPCYLSKHNCVIEEPREILRTIPGVQLIEMEHFGKRSLCCGGGGGGVWRDTKKGERLAEIRLEEALKAEVDTLVTACPYCLMMLEESRISDDKFKNIQIMDICEIILEGIAL